MDPHTPDPLQRARGDRDAELVRGLIAVAQLMIATDDVGAVYAFLVAECVRRLGLTAASLLLTGEQGREPVAAVGDAATALVGIEHHAGVGPSVDAAASGREVDVDIDEARDRWPAWGSVAAAHGVVRVTALPVRLVESSVGALELLVPEGRTLNRTDCQVARSFAGLAAVVVHHDAEMRRTSTQVRQLEHALSSRVIVEQAKGFLMAHGCAGPEQAFEVMRAQARRSGRRVHAVAEDVLLGRLDPLRLCS